MVWKYACNERTKSGTSRLTETLFTARRGCATSLRRESYWSFDTKRLVEDVAQKFGAVGTDDAVGGRLQRFRERSLHAPPIYELRPLLEEDDLPDVCQNPRNSRNAVKWRSFSTETSSPIGSVKLKRKALNPWRFFDTSALRIHDRDVMSRGVWRHVIRIWICNCECGASKWHWMAE